jgi:hypothetical protein
VAGVIASLIRWRGCVASKDIPHQVSHSSGDCLPHQVEGIPRDFSFGEIEPDWERIAPFLEKAMARVPASLQVGAKKLFCGPESFTPDLRPIVSERLDLTTPLIVHLITPLMASHSI